MGKQLSGAQKRKKKKEREEAIKEAAAGMERLKLGPTELWTGLVLHHKDIFVSRVISKLNTNDIKFLYEVHSETRKLIKRSSRAGDLKQEFNVEEMSSISTLEVAWENRSLRPDYWTEAWFCSEVARTNKLELLKWIREEKKCEWDAATIKTATDRGNLEMVKYCVANQCPIGEMACARAAENGHLECLKYLREEVKAPCGTQTAARAAQNGHLHILEYLVERKFDEYNEFVYAGAAREGHLDCLVYLHETAKAPWDEGALEGAHENNHAECVQYLLDNDCPIPRGWRYEDGELHVPESDPE
ncbi:unnamed protein product [Bathycoccus prasinos]